MKPHRVTVLVNISSGMAAEGRSGKIREELETAFIKHAIKADLEFLSGEKLHSGAERTLQQAAEGNLDAIIVAGGDGSIRTVASVLAGSGVPLGVIPTGTLNHFAKDLKIPLAIGEAVEIITEGNARYVDVGELNGRVFINNSSIGIYPYLVLDRERRRRNNGWSKWLAMVWAALRVLRHFPLRHLSIHGQGWTETVRSPCVFVGNNEYNLTGPSIGARDRLDGGELCVYVATEQSAGALVWLAIRSALGLLNQQRDLRSAVCSSVDISSRHRKLLVALDGEVESIQSPLHYRIRPKALLVFAPLTTNN